MIVELTTDNAGMCRFHRGWSEKLWPEIVTGHFGSPIDYAGLHARLAKAIHAQGHPVYWECARIEQMLHAYLRTIQGEAAGNPEAAAWLQRFEGDPAGAAWAYFMELKTGIADRFKEVA